MKAPHDEDPRLDPDAQDFARRIADAWTPAELSAAERARFDARLAERLERRRARRLWRPIAASAIGALGLLLALWYPSGDAPAPTAARAGDAELILAFAREPEAEDDAETQLPGDYQAIAALLVEP